MRRYEYCQRLERSTVRLIPPSTLSMSRTSRTLLLLPLILLIHSTLFSLTAGQLVGCAYTGPYPFPTYSLTLTFLNTSPSSLPPIFPLWLSTALDFDLQQTLSPSPTASTITDLPCLNLTSPTPPPPPTSPPTTLITIAVLGSIITDCGIDPLTTTQQLILDLRGGLIENVTRYPLDPNQHVPVVVLCPDGSQVAVGQEGMCAGGGGGRRGGVGEG